MPDVVLSTLDFANPLCPFVTPPDTVIFSDTFNRADTEGLGSLGNTPTGNLPWSTIWSGGGGGPVPGISGNKGYFRGYTNTSSSRGLVTVDPVVADGVLKATMVDRGDGVDNGNGIYLGIQVVDHNNQLFVTPRAAASPFGVTLYKRVAGTGSVVAASSVAAVAGDIIEVTRQGNMVSVSINGTERIAPVSVAGLITGAQTRVGFGGYAIGAASGGGKVNHWDNISFYVPGEWSV